MQVKRIQVDNTVFKAQLKARANGGKIIMIGVPISPSRLADVELATQIDTWDNRPDVFSYYKATPFCAFGRNQIVRYAMLKVPEVSHIMFFDSDTIPPPETLDVLLSHDKDIVTGVQPLFLASKGGIVWNVMASVDDIGPSSFEPIGYGNLPNELFKIKTCGFGAVLIKRGVFEKMGWPWFKDLFAPDRWAVGQDAFFTTKAQECGYEVWADPNLQCGHNKNINLLEVARLMYGNRKRISDLRPSLFLECDYDKNDMSLINEAKVMSRGYATHIPVIASVIAHTSGPVLELGCGFGSTPLLHQMCLSTRREIVSCDSSTKWIDALSKYRNNGHHLISVDDWDKCEVFDKEWGVVFVDHKPIRQRAPHVQRLMNKAQYIIVHDTDSSLYGYEPVFDKFKYRYDYTELRPWTTVVSNFNSLDFLKGE